ncbi:MAG: hypothetical protein JKX69_02515, partial [Rhodobacteraceae bacterium]|nr:hypothetical protein [Paracoccaceae bacterium]
MANTPKAKPAAKAAKSSKKKPASARAPAAHTAKHSATRTAVLVLGMHRSGTSFVTRLLSLAGCALPATLIAASPTNPAGHWESRAVQSFNDKVLASIGSRWDDWGTIDPSWFGTPQAAELRVEAQALLVAEFGDAPLFVLKEPRICRLVPFWLEVLQTAGIAVKIVSVLRHPLETAASLERRNAMPFAAGQALWLRYVLDAEKFSRGTVRVFIHYNDLMQDWAGTLARLDGALGDVLPLKSAAIAGEAEAFLAPGL